MAEAADKQFWRDVEEAFSAVLEAGESGRTAALEAHCAGRAALRAEVETLLEAHARSEEFILPETTAFLAGQHDGHDAPDAHVDSRIGAFRLTQRIAEGGMGAVYRAERVEGDFTQQVAVKLIAARLYGADTLRRFRAERQILASLQHPNIVSLLDGGVTPSGHPYIAMEYVEGVPITEYCTGHRLSLEARLQLFRQLCTAVSFAHHHLVVHRDLKPANVLVTADRTVKVLDFGVAKLIEPEGMVAEVTSTLLGPLTPDYASPEQINGAPVTTACDVYALGVMLYELLAGHKPYLTAGKSMDELMALVLVQEPPRPSTAAAGELPYEPRRLRGDLDAIVLQAMAKDPDARYASPDELAAEIQRHLAGLPVVAREPSLRYLAGKALVRHKTAFTVASVLVVLLLVTLAGALWQARVAARERERAERRFAQTQQLAHAVIFKIHDAIVGLPGATRARQLIVDEARAYLQELSDDPSAGDELRIKLAEAYRELGTVQGYPGLANLGDAKGAIASYERGLALLEPLLARSEAPLPALYEGSTLLARASHTLASLPKGRAEAEQAARRSLAIATRLSAREADSDRTLRALSDANIMLAYSVDPAAAAPFWQAALDQHAALLRKAPEDPDRIVMVALMESNVAWHFEAHLQGAAAQPHHRNAKQLYDQLLTAGARTRWGDEARAVILGNSGVAKTQLGDVLEARRVLEESLAIRLRIAHADAADANAWPKAAQAHAELARTCEALADEQAALSHARAALEVFGRNPPEPKLFGLLAETQARAGRLALRAGRRLEACTALGRAAAIFEQIGGNGRLSPLQQKQRDESAALRQTCGT